MVKNKDDKIFIIPQGTEYNSEIQSAINRRRAVDYCDNKLITKKNCRVGKEIYSIKSIFDMNSKRTTEDNLKYLINQELDKIS